MITLVTSIFLHGGWFHFISNMWILFIFGDNVEDQMGPIGYASFYLLSGVAAGLLHTFVQPFSVIPTLGASGAIAGILGAYLLLYPNARVVTLVPLIFIFTTVNVPAVLYLGFWFMSQLFSGLTSLGVAMTGVAWWAHIGGFLFGLVMVRFFLWRKDPVRELDSYYQVVHKLPKGKTWY
jgi:membrane associated rhomboid family serine protease